MGDKIGRIHLGKQELGDLQTRKMKSLKRGRSATAEHGEDGELHGADSMSDTEGAENGNDGINFKKTRRS